MLLLLIIVKPIINSFYDLNLIGGVKLLQMISGLTFVGFIFDIFLKKKVKNVSKIQDILSFFPFYT